MKLENLKTKFLGQNIIYYEEIDSTQSEIKRKINNIKNGTIVIADIQTKGQGTHGRVWHTNQKNNIAFSFVVYIDKNIEVLSEITIEIAEIMIKAIKNIYEIQLEIKFPNDIFYQGKKIGGILSETILQGEKVKYLIVGIGLNTTQQVFSKYIENIASSIKNEFGIQVDREKIITEFCNLFEKNIIERIK